MSASVLSRTWNIRTTEPHTSEWIGSGCDSVRQRSHPLRVTPLVQLRYSLLSKSSTWNKITNERLSRTGPGKVGRPRGVSGGPPGSRSPLVTSEFHIVGRNFDITQTMWNVLECLTLYIRITTPNNNFGFLLTSRFSRSGLFRAYFDTNKPLLTFFFYTHKLYCSL